MMQAFKFKEGYPLKTNIRHLIMSLKRIKENHIQRKNKASNKPLQAHHSTSITYINRQIQLLERILEDLDKEYTRKNYILNLSTAITDFEGLFIQFFCDNKRHLVCKPYSIENLHLMAEELNIKRCWFHKDHYDIPKKRIKEITQKCNVITPLRILNIIKGIDDQCCPKCGGAFIESKALVNKLTGTPDFIGSKEVCTLSASGKVDLTNVSKCSKCGHSKSL